MVGDLTGHAAWLLEQREPGVVHIPFEWTVNAGKPLIRLLTPLLRPLFRWNHNYATARARAGLEPYARREAGHDAVYRPRATGTDRAR